MLKKVIDNIYGRYYHIDEKGNWQGERVIYWSSGNIYLKEYFKNDKCHGICTVYKETGEIDFKEYWWNGERIYRKKYFQNVLKELEN